MDNDAKMTTPFWNISAPQFLTRKFVLACLSRELRIYQKNFARKKVPEEAINSPIRDSSR